MPQENKDPRSVFYTEELLGLTHLCDAPYCTKQAISTGWLLYDRAIDRWLIEFTCPEDGQLPVWTEETDGFIKKIVTENRLTLP